MKAWQRRIIGILAIAGGAAGAVIAFGFLFRPQHITAYFFIPLFMAYYLWGVWCGVKLLERAPDAIRNNMIFWAAQIPIIDTSIIGYTLASGAALQAIIQIPTGTFSFNWFLGASFEYSLFQGETPFTIGINLLALGIVILLGKRNGSEDNP